MERCRHCGALNSVRRTMCFQCGVDLAMPAATRAESASLDRDNATVSGDAAPPDGVTEGPPAWVYWLWMAVRVAMVGSLLCVFSVLFLWRHPPGSGGMVLWVPSWGSVVASIACLGLSAAALQSVAQDLCLASRVRWDSEGVEVTWHHRPAKHFVWDSLAGLTGRVVVSGDAEGFKGVTVATMDGDRFTVAEGLNPDCGGLRSALVHHTSLEPVGSPKWTWSRVLLIVVFAAGLWLVMSLRRR
jgi:hypothetical protein